LDERGRGPRDERSEGRDVRGCRHPGFLQDLPRVSTITVEQALQLAITCHQTGQLAAAEPLYRRVLAVQPQHAEALHRLGVLKRETNRWEEAAELFARAIAQAPHQAQYHLDLGAAYRQMGRLEEALACEQRALALDPNFAGAPGLDRPKPASRPAESGRRLYCASPRAALSGWGVCMMHLIGELSQRLELVSPESFPSTTAQFDGPVFMPLQDHAFNPYLPVRGTRNFGYTFFEYPLEQPAASNAARYDVIFCGSTWCLERMRERGINNGKVLVQGVDRNVFHPTEEAKPPAHGEFRIFTGGKFEIRKGQDVVIAAFRELLGRYPRARLVCAWHNWWPNLIESMSQSPHLAMPSGQFETQVDLFRALLVRNGIPETNFEILPPLTQTDLAGVMRSTDIGVFPNRCEGGTNLVLMEYLACGRPVVASAATGHADVIAPDHALALQPRLTARFWDEPEVAEVAAAIKQLLESPDLRSKLGAAAAEAMRKWTWPRAAQTIIDTIFPAGG